MLRQLCLFIRSVIHTILSSQLVRQLSGMNGLVVSKPKVDALFVRTGMVVTSYKEDAKTGKITASSYTQAGNLLARKLISKEEYAIKTRGK